MIPRPPSPPPSPRRPNPPHSAPSRDAGRERHPIGASPLGPSVRTARHEPAPLSGEGDGIISDTLRERVRAMGEQFLLSDREVDVLTFYALGYTQKKVAEELSITPATTHSHIKRIYSKCGMHSRQEILEYLASYGR